ncbi:hypothetical protein Agub_g8416 [Astrephomene gubernaculifera]|uniref:Uncharacterized protein n=1 Tax=Astrephomene gubernaculifera TaxID=47775 RepID=A0AAD3DRM1_9CHLO|nr:hypothetical protein Agub_g8416 [Astrephomene gubernaculifera]
MSAVIRTKPFCATRTCNVGFRRGVRVVAMARVHPQTLASTAAAAVAASALLLAPQVSYAAGIESVELSPASFLSKPAGPTRAAEQQREKLAQADEAFQNSSTLKELLAKSEANKAKNRKDIQNKYCYRQAELGVGDCGGLRYIPGLTESGKQKTPKWLADLLGVESQETSGGPAEGRTLKELIENGSGGSK